MMEIPLNKKVNYSGKYDSSLIFAIPRKNNRELLGIKNKHDYFTGIDLWNAYEISWLDENGKPEVRIAKIIFCANSENLIESKSLKLYLNSFNSTRFRNEDIVVETIKKDLAIASKNKVIVNFSTVDSPVKFTKIEGENIDDIAISTDCYTVNSKLLTTNNIKITETLTSNLLKSNCLVTSQPDWGSVVIKYSGNTIDRKGLLKYIISFRNHDEFHEHCVERIFMDILNICKPEKLSVYAKYTRRGGLDINPFRSNFEQEFNQCRTPRQ